jgi:hypothetical protein
MRSTKPIAIQFGSHSFFLTDFYGLCGNAAKSVPRVGGGWGPVEAAAFCARRWYLGLLPVDCLLAPSGAVIATGIPSRKSGTL